MRVDDRIRKTVVFIGQTSNGIFVPHGTGFLTVSISADSEIAWQTLVTARHVIDGISGDIVSVRVNTHNSGAQLIDTKKEGWYFNSNKQLDVAVYPTFIPKDQFDILHLPLTQLDGTEDCVLTQERIDRFQLGIGDEVYVTGMFVSHLGEGKNLPILRIGTIAAMPEERLETNYGFHDAFLVEVRSIDGLSGSPVCINLQGRIVPYTMPARSLPHPSEPRYLTFLLGMVLGYNEIFNPRDVIEMGKTSKLEAAEAATRAAIPMNTGIAVVLPIWRIIETIYQPGIVEIRERIMTNYKMQKGWRFVPTNAAPIGMPKC